MHRFDRLERNLLAAGVAPRFVCRTIHELHDHCADLEDASRRAGYSVDDAQALAREALGSDEAITRAVCNRRELLCWSRRWPRTAGCIETSCTCLLLPAAPFIYCFEHGSVIVRWGVSTSLAALVTGGMLFSLQWLIL